MRGHLKGLRNCLEAHRKKWCNEENEIDNRRRLVDEATVLRRLQNEERRKAFEASWEKVRARALQALDEGTFEGAIVPIGLRPPEQRGERRAAGQGSAEDPEKRTFLRALEEPPEGLGKYSEGGSSGSGGPLRPEEEVPEEEVIADEPYGPEAPPPWPAPPEDPPPEADPSKADEVKRKIAEAPARLEVEAYVALEEEFVAVAKPEDLRQEDREAYEEVRGVGVGVCGRCKWRYGCASCDEGKAWGYACRSTLWHTAHEAVRPKAKPRGRPKKAA